MYENKVKLIANHVIELQKLYMQVYTIYSILLNYYEKGQGKNIGKFDVNLLSGGKGGFMINQFYNTINNIVFDREHMLYCTGITFNTSTRQHPYNGILNFLMGNLDENMLLRDISNLIVNIGCQLNKKYIYNGSGINLNNAEINTIGSISHMNKCQGSCTSMGENLNRQKYGLAFDNSDVMWTHREDNKDTKDFIDSSIYICMVLKNSIMKISKYYRMEELWILSDINEYGKMLRSYTSPIPPYIMNLYIRLFSLEKANEKMNKLNLILSNSIYVNNFNTNNTFVKSIISEWISEITNAEYKNKIINIPKFYKVLKLQNIEDMRCGYCKHNSIGIVINRNRTISTNENNLVLNELNKNPEPSGLGIGNTTIHYYCTNEKCGAFLGCSSGSIDGLLKQTGQSVISKGSNLFNTIMDKTPDVRSKFDEIIHSVTDKIKSKQ